VSGSVSKLIVSYIGSNPLVQDLVLANKIEAELVPQGTLVERIRASGAGLGGVLTQTGIGTLAAESKRVLKINGTEWLLELPLRADIALLACHKADEAGNLVYRNTSQNLNPVMATAGDRVVVEARQVVPIGKIAPDQVMTPGIFVDYLVGPTN
jgi:acetate CoA/acetoacetate CoA-transferase alpha subunit